MNTILNLFPKQLEKFNSAVVVILTEIHSSKNGSSLLLEKVILIYLDKIWDEGWNKHGVQTEIFVL